MEDKYFALELVAALGVHLGADHHHALPDLRPLDLLQRHVAEAHGKLASRLNNRKLDIIVLLLKHKKLTWWYSIVCLLLTISPELKKDTIVILSNLSRTSSIKQTKLPDTFLTMMIQFLFL